MKLTTGKQTASLVLGVILLTVASRSIAHAPALPNPVLYFLGPESLEQTNTKYQSNLAETTQ